MARPPKTQGQITEPQEPHVPEPEMEQEPVEDNGAAVKSAPEAENPVVVARLVTDNEQNRIISRILRQNRQERTMQKYAAKNRKLKQEVKRLEQEVQALQKK